MENANLMYTFSQISPKQEYSCCITVTEIFARGRKEKSRKGCFWRHRLWQVSYIYHVCTTYFLHEASVCLLSTHWSFNPWKKEWIQNRNRKWKKQSGIFISFLHHNLCMWVKEGWWNMAVMLLPWLQQSRSLEEQGSDRSLWWVFNLCFQIKTSC